jgi:hypothetical protein
MRMNVLKCLLVVRLVSQERYTLFLILNRDEEKSEFRNRSPVAQHLYMFIWLLDTR